MGALAYSMTLLFLEGRIHRSNNFLHCASIANVRRNATSNDMCSGHVIFPDALTMVILVCISFRSMNLIFRVLVLRDRGRETATSQVDLKTTKQYRSIVSKHIGLYYRSTIQLLLFLCAVL